MEIGLFFSLMLVLGLIIFAIWCHYCIYTKKNKGIIVATLAVTIFGLLMFAGKIVISNRVIKHPSSSYVTKTYDLAKPNKYIYTNTQPVVYYRNGNSVKQVNIDADAIYKKDDGATRIEFVKYKKWFLYTIKQVIYNV